MSRHVPVFLRHESVYFAFPVHYHLERRGLHPAARKSALYFARQYGAHFIAHEPVEYAARLLRVHKVHIDGARRFYRATYRFGSDLVEFYTVFKSVESEMIGKMPAYRFPFAVRVRRKIGEIGILYFLPQPLDEFLLFGVRHDVFGLESVGNVYAERLGRQIAYMPARRHYSVTLPEILLNRFCLGRRLDYN